MKKILIYAMILILSTVAVGCGSVEHVASNDKTADQTAKEVTPTPKMKAVETPQGTNAADANKKTAAATTKEGASSEFRIYGKKANGFPENYPEQLVPAYKVKDILNAEGNSWGCTFEYSTTASYDEVAAYFRELLKNKTDFEEDERSDDTFHCRTSDWDINVNVMKMFGDVKVMIELYTISEDNPYLE